MNAPAGKSFQSHRDPVVPMRGFELRTYDYEYFVIANITSPSAGFTLRRD